ncbi:MAG TPA: DUF1570 domain-containing protein, partial [Polyangiaceae bacterium]|nr:DUF1570 domain-containing protein [Polyangiaceae bacterium]
TWLEIETAHFHLHTDLAELPARDLAQSLEEVRAGLLTLSWAKAPGPPDRSEVVVFARPSEFSRVRGDSRAAGELAHRPGFGRLIVFSPGAEATLSTTAVHELAHELSFWFIPVQPTWFAEGLATFLETLTVDRATGRARLGEISKSSAAWLQGHLWSSGKLFATSEALSIDPRESASFYSSSWLLMHYLLNQHNVAFGRFQQQLAKLRDWRVVWQVELPQLTTAPLDASLVAYGRRSEFSIKEAELHLPAFEAKVRRLSAAEAHGVLARTAYVVGNEALAEQELEKAQRLDPSDVNAAEVEFSRLTSDPARVELARRISKAHPRSANAWLLLARSDTSPQLRAAALERARALSPEHPHVHWLSGWQALAERRPEAALAHAHRVLRRWAVTPNLLALEVHALAANGGCDVARRIVADAPVTMNARCESLQTHQPVPCDTELKQALAAACPAPSAPRSASRERAER